MRVRRSLPGEARRQAASIAAMEPWRSLGYRAATLGAWLGRLARKDGVRVAVAGRGRAAEVLAIIVVQPDVLLGDFIALLAVRPERAGQGLGRALVEEAAARTFRRRRWLYTSSDAENRAAARFYRRVGFERVGRLPGLLRPARTEVLWRRGRMQAPLPAEPRLR